MKAEDFIKKEGYIPQLVYFQEGKGDVYLDLEKLLQEYAKLKCQEQRIICADDAEADYNTLQGGYIDAFVIKDSILNAPTPEM